MSNRIPKSLTISGIVHAELDEKGKHYVYDIPEAWVLGYTHGTDKTYHDAVMHWHRQALLEAKHKADKIALGAVAYIYGTKCEG